MIIYLLGKLLLAIINVLTAFIRNTFSSVWSYFSSLSGNVSWTGVGFASAFIEKVAGWNFLIYSLTTAVYIILFVKAIRWIVGLISKG